jgi:molybdate/tungstate transport system substrate-binding protein
LQLAFALLGASYLMGGGGATAAPEREVVTLFHAGSLAAPMAAMEDAFEARHPEIDLRRESSGSSKAARKISDLGKPCDIIAVADYRVIDRLLRPEYTSNNIRFASNRMVLCFTDRSRFATEIDGGNWMQILLRPGVSWGHSSPDFDPCGYRALMVLQLAARHYDAPRFYEWIMASRESVVVRPKAVELISLLQTGNLDYAWEYRSVAVQHGLRFLELPAEINLGEERFDAAYGRAMVRVAGRSPGSRMSMEGSSITYGVALLDAAPHRAAAVTFLRFMLDPAAGLELLRQAGQPPLVPPRVPTPQMRATLPPELQPLLRVAE